jgi:hypothetical protein
MFSAITLSLPEAPVATSNSMAVSVEVVATLLIHKYKSPASPLVDAISSVHAPFVWIVADAVAVVVVFKKSTTSLSDSRKYQGTLRRPRIAW